MRQLAPNGKAEVVLSPAARVIDLFGSAKASALVGLTSEALKKWRRPVSKGGQGGLVPSKYQSIYLAEARRSGLPLDAEHFIAEPVL